MGLPAQKQPIPPPWWGTAIVGALLAVTAGLWLAAKHSTGGLAAEPWRSAGQAAGLTGMVLLGFAAILSSRLPFVERFTGGLDRAYRLHRAVSVAGFVAILYHPFLLAMNAVPPMGAALRYVLPGGILSYSLGILALYAFVALVVITVFVRLPYRWWKWTHVLMGIPLAFAVLHMLLIPSDVARSLPLRLWVLLWGGGGLAAALYRRFGYARLGPRYRYRIASVRSMGADVTEVVLRPVGAPLPYTAGQFVFLAAAVPGMSREEHPFSISSASHEPLLRLSIKRMGDYTRTVGRFRPGDPVVLHGPYGTFGARALAACGQPQVWVAGGIGITPFLSLLRDAVAGPCPFRHVRLAVVTRTPKESPYRGEIDALAARSDGRITVVHHHSADAGRITARDIGLPDASGSWVFLCGPPGMMADIADQFAGAGVPRRRIVYEDFSFLS